MHPWHEIQLGGVDEAIALNRELAGLPGLLAA
jgi:hypothetical protein